MPEPCVCICGCGEPTKGGQFRPGHDARYKSHLIKEALAGGNPEAEEILAQRGWTKFLDKAREVQARPRKTQQGPREPKAPRAADLLQLMKAAARVLRWTGQYKRGTVNYIAVTPHNAFSIATMAHPELPRPLPADNPGFSEKEQAAIDKAIASSRAV